ncbi:hypothetical protein A3A66_04760 [Microgenomates group bacterium RIFCSPLOWO2_01_FULL_46_13]|nr:MAG: hypothetical protein A3A66_04760 [Microgenomates group bacterium RIFCSPLOWO2_01_FULL_46_13]
MKKISTLFSLFIVGAFVLSACSALGISTGSTAEAPAAAPTPNAELAEAVKALGGAQVLINQQGEMIEALSQKVENLEAAPAATTAITPTLAAPAPAATPEIEVNWTFVPLAKYFEATTIDGIRWVRPNGTYMATDLTNGRYDAVEVTRAVGGDAGWCKEGQYGCPPWLGLYHAVVTEGTTAIMDIPTRIRISGEDGGKFRLAWRFNDELRDGTEKTLLDDYNTAASQGQLGLFVATVDPSMMPGTLVYLDQKYAFGYGCWDCLAHTSGKDTDIVSLDDPSIGHMGTDTPTLGDSLWPSYVIPIPSPEEDPNFMVSLTVEFPKGTDVVVWFGRYDPEKNQ